MSIYTGSGDGGSTSLADGTRLAKDHPRMEAIGEMDEVNSWIGFLRAALAPDHSWQGVLRDIQRELMTFMGMLAESPAITPEKRSLLQFPFVALEKLMDEMETEMGPLRVFLFPGGTEVAARCHLIRTKVRAAERRLVALHRESPLPADMLIFMNRLSDLFFQLARYEMQKNGSDEESWNEYRV